MDLRQETIVAIATPAGVGAIAVIRLSGPCAFAVAQQHVGVKKWQPRTAHYAHFMVDGRMLDEVVATYYPAPHSYTGDDSVEIACHGSSYVQQTLLQTLLQHTQVRMALPGEFTQRAFLNGKFDLAQAEAVADLIDSHSEATHRLAINQLRGGFSKELSALRDKFVELTALLELELDFSDEEVEFADRGQLMDLLNQLEMRTSKLVNSFMLGNAIKNGVPVAIVGRPNAGKSTLLNALLHDERAIVSPIAGTTRDTIEETLNLDGTLFRFIDTAGIRQSDDVIETAGVDRSFKAIEKAQIVLYLIPANVSALEAEEELAETLSKVSMDNKKLIVVRTKCAISSYDPKPISGYETINLSAKEGTGMDALVGLIDSYVQYENTDTTLLTNVRHYEAMKHILSAIGNIRDGFICRMPSDLIVVDIRDAIYHLGTVTGQVTNNEVLGTIFSRFCIGK